MVTKAKKEKMRLLYLLGFKKKNICKLFDIGRGHIEEYLKGIPEEKRVVFHLQNADLNKLYKTYVER